MVPVSESQKVNASMEKPVGEAVQGPFDSDGSDTATARWVTLSEAAAVVGVPSNTIRRAAKAGTIRGHRAGEAQNAPWLVHLEDVEARWGERASVLEAAAEGASGRTVKSTTKDDFQRGRLSKLRDRLVISEPKQPWWRPNRSGREP